MARYLVAGWMQQLFPANFPSGTLVVNIVGSFILGFLMRYSVDFAGLSPDVKAFLTIGFCGGFTTFSTFSYETMALIQEGQWTRAGVYVAASLGLSLAAALAGVYLAQQILIHGRQA